MNTDRTNWRRRATAVARVAVAAWSVSALCVLSACDNQDSTSPTPAAITLTIDYSAPPASSLPPPTDPMCAHHYAPSNYSLTTDWGANVRLQQIAENTYRQTIDGAPTAQSHWVALYDIAFCSINNSPRVTSGIAINGVALTEVIQAPDGGAAMSFSIDAHGGIKP